jgi:uncharacterized membrane protein
MVVGSFARYLDAPAAEVWAAMIDVETWPEWASQFKRLDRLDERRRLIFSRNTRRATMGLKMHMERLNNAS